ncbi:multidrug effflux MFS transporter [Woodsholea maritima]|uniref:multidrug effflux MFS transporter n=1 Tax=Woodsholea maritima TaxID=240237 RepID=UPI00035CEF38|nr:multidrug effflux MFS transporter [Woodsholea maritima]
MSKVSTPSPQRPVKTLALWELIALTAAFMAMNALSIDIVLPALKTIGDTIGASEHQRPLMITAYIFGFGISQLFYGPIADAVGRRATLLVSLVGYLIATLLCFMVHDLTWMLVARALQGVASAGTRVIAMAVIRDSVSGRKMAQVFSIAMTVFMAAPILAPSIGQGILFIADWHWIFIALFIAGAGLLVWSYFRLPETRAVEDRTPLSLGSALKGYWIVMQNRITLGYLLASCFVFGSLFSFISLADQMLGEKYHLGARFPLAFAGIALGLMVTNILNAKLVERVGMRRLSHGALVGFIVINLSVTLWTFTLGEPPFWVFYAGIAGTLMMFGLLGANFSALVMEPAGHHAGTAAALFGSATAVAGAAIGSIIGALYNGSVLPFVTGQVIMGVAAIILVLWTERGRLFGEGVYEAVQKDEAA